VNKDILNNDQHLIPQRRFVFLLLFILTGCQHFEFVASSQVKPLLQLSTADLHQEISVLQKVSANYQGREQSFIAQLEISKTGLVMVGMTEFGATLFTLRYDNQVIDFQPSPLLKMPINPAFLLSDFQLIYWPFDVIQNSLTGDQQLSQSKVSPYERQLTIERQPSVTIQYNDRQRWVGNVSFRQHKNNYELNIQTLEISEL